MPHADVMNTQQAPVKKSHLVTDLAGIGLVLGLVGMFLGWRASNLEQTSALGSLLIVVGVALLVIAGILHLRKRGAF